MRIKEIEVRRYGSRLQPFQHRFRKNLAVIFGPNGSGKTLIIDAILKMLLGRSSNDFIRHGSIEEEPQGYIVIKKGGEEYQLNGRKVLSDYEIDVTPDELKSIFVIEDGDLEITDEDEFYGRITDKLVGVRTGDIHRVKKALRDRGRLTPSLGISGRAPYHIKTKLAEAKELRDEIQGYLEEAESVGIREWEGKRFSLQYRVRDLNERIETLRKACEKADYENLMNILNEAEEYLNNLENLPDEERLLELKANLTKLNNKIQERPQLNEEAGVWRNVFRYSIIPGTIVLISLLVFGLASVALPILALGLLGITLFSLYKWQTASGALGDIASLEQSVVMEAKKIGLAVDTSEKATEEIDEIESKRKKLNSGFDQKIGVIKDKFNIDEEDRRKSIEEARKELENIKKGIDFTVDTPYDKEELESSEEDRESAEEELKEFKEKLQDHHDRLSDFSQRAHELKFSDGFSIFELDLEIDNLESLRELVKQLEEFIENIEKDAWLSKTAHEIFMELESKEKRKSESLFQEGNRASRILKEITEGMFKGVRYHVEEGEIVVDRQGDERPQRASELSRGEWTQLYIAIRVALGEKLLEGEKGFFIVEEPFIHTDPERLLKQFDMLKKLSETGWQTIYFTAKDEIKRGLPKYADAELIELERLP